MQLFSWLQKRTSARPRTGRAPIQGFRPRLEVLEGRDVPSTLTVTSFGDNGRGSLRYEIAAAQSGDTIAFKKSLSGGTIYLTSGNELFIGKNLTIQGPGAGLLTITPFNWNTSRIFEVGPGATVTLSGLTITHGGGYAARPGTGSYAYDGDGGAILNHGTLTMSGCTLSNNSAIPPADSATFGNPGSHGGAIFSTGVLTVNGCTLSSNSADYGGGIANAGTATVNGCTLSDNSAGYGGGIYNTGHLAVLNSFFSGNRGATSPDYTQDIWGPYTDGGGNTFG